MAASQPDLLRQLGELTADEASALAAWTAMSPEPPTDLALDRQSTAEGRTPLLAILEDDPDAQAATWPQAEADEARDASAATRQKAAAQTAGELTPRELITEEPHVDEPTPQAGSGIGHPPPGGRDEREHRDAATSRPDGAQDPATAVTDPPKRPQRATARDDMSGVPWPLQHSRRDVEGWETEP